MFSITTIENPASTLRIGRVKLDLVTFKEIPLLFVLYQFLTENASHIPPSPCHVTSSRTGVKCLPQDKHYGKSLLVPSLHTSSKSTLTESIAVTVGRHRSDSGQPPADSYPSCPGFTPLHYITAEVGSNRCSTDALIAHPLLRLG